MSFKFKKMNFGPAGFSGSTLEIPKSSKNPTADSIPLIKDIGLSALEIEFVRNVYLKNASEEKINQIKQNAIDNDISLSIHAPYFVNLNAQEEQKIINSKRYILDSLNVGQKIGAKNIVVHIGYFLKQDPKIVLENISENIQDIKDNYKGETLLGIELTGKKTQVGSLDELFYFYEKFPKFVTPVIDFAHQHARDVGYFKDKKNISSFFKRLESYPKLKEGLHIHMSGINYTEKGERNHLTFRESDFPYIDILKELKEKDYKGTIICESPQTVPDCLFLKEVYEKL